MRRLIGSLLLCALLGSCATDPNTREHTLVQRAIDQLGGESRLGQVRTLTAKGTVKHWEPEQSYQPGGEMRFAAESTFELQADLTQPQFRTDWVRKYAYPSPRTWQFSEIVTRDYGYVIGIDSTARTKESQETQPPAHTMSSLRLASALRELKRASHSLLMQMHNKLQQVSRLPDVTIGSIVYPALQFVDSNNTFIVLFDPESGLPARVRTGDYDAVLGDVNYDLVYSDWRTVNGVKFAMRQQYELDGRVVADYTYGDVAFNTPVAAARFAVPERVVRMGARPSTGLVPHQWVQRRQFIGTYLDSENPLYDTQSSTGLRLVTLANGVEHVTGGTHNSLVVEMRDHLIVFDAPISDLQSNWTLNALRGRYPGKPVRYLVLTHHHMDHIGGLRAYAAQGATVVVGAGAAPHYRRILAAPYTRNPNLAGKDLSKTPILEVKDRHAFSDGARTVTAHNVENPHAAATLIGYVADVRIAFVTDLYSPGRDPLPAKINPALAAVVDGVRKAGITPQRIAGGHGSVADFAPLAALADGK